MLREDRNADTIKYLQAKLVKKTDKLEKVTDWFLDKDEIGGTVGEALTLGTEENIKTLTAASAVPIAPLAVGVGSLVLGMIVIFPLLGGPATGEQEQMFLQSVENAGGKLFEFTGKSLSLSAKLAALPLGVAAISVPKKIFRLLADKVDEKTYPQITNNQNIIELIDDILAKKDDPTLVFPATFLKRVDIRRNSEKVNIELLGHLAYLRHCVNGVKEGTKTEDDVRDAFESIVAFLEKAKGSFWFSKEFKQNRFVKLLAEDDAYTVEDFYPTLGK